MSETDVIIEDATLIPDEFCTAEITMPYNFWTALLEFLEDQVNEKPS